MDSLVFMFFSFFKLSSADLNEEEDGMKSRKHSDSHSIIYLNNYIVINLKSLGFAYINYKHYYSTL